MAAETTITSAAPIGMPQARPATNGMMALEMLSMFHSVRAEAHDYRPDLPKPPGRLTLAGHPGDKESGASDPAFCAKR